MSGAFSPISIHALREEGDARLPVLLRAEEISIHALREEGDQQAAARVVVAVEISIHALREEGDRLSRSSSVALSRFLSTPSARRATSLLSAGPLRVVISIHALREEGDAAPGLVLDVIGISIHALREEGDEYPAGAGLPNENISIHALREEGDLCTG